MPRTLLLATLATASKTVLRAAGHAPRAAATPAAALGALPAAAQNRKPKPPGGTASRTEGYEVQKSEAEWQRQLSSVEYFVLRNGGTEPPNSSPLVKEKRPGEFRCAGCGVPLFASSAKFDSGTGWPSFATQLPAVAVEKSALEFLAGAEIRCAPLRRPFRRSVFGWRFVPGHGRRGVRPAPRARRSATVFYPADDSAPVRGEFDPQKPRELPAWAQPPGIKVNAYCDARCARRRAGRHCPATRLGGRS